MDHQDGVTEEEFPSAQQRLELNGWKNSKICLSVEQTAHRGTKKNRLPMWRKDLVFDSPPLQLSKGLNRRRGSDPIADRREVPKTGFA